MLEESFLMNIYLVQMDIAWGDKQKNFSKVKELLDSCAVLPDGLIILPEMFATGFMHAPREGMAEDFDDENSETVKFLAELAAKTGCIVQGGGIAQEKKYLKNHTGVFYPGEVAENVSYDKIQLFPSEQKNLVEGEDVITFPVSDMLVTPFTCYDLRFPELFRDAIPLGAQAFSIGASWPAVRAKHWEILLQARAVENQAFVFGVNRVGKDPYTEYAGGSMIISPKGEILAQAKDEECVVTTEIFTEDVVSWRKEFSALKDAGLLD